MECISVVGLGKLGLCMAAAIADAGYRVMGVDVVPQVVDTVNKGLSPYVEPGLPEMLGRCRRSRRISGPCSR